MTAPSLRRPVLALVVALGASVCLAGCSFDGRATLASDGSLAIDGRLVYDPGIQAGYTDAPCPDPSVLPRGLTGTPLGKNRLDGCRLTGTLSAADGHSGSGPQWWVFADRALLFIAPPSVGGDKPIPADMAVAVTLAMPGPIIEHSGGQASGRTVAITSAADLLGRDGFAVTSRRTMAADPTGAVAVGAAALGFMAVSGLFWLRMRSL